MTVRIMMLALCTALTARSAPAQRIIRETAAQWSAAPRLALTVEGRWCVDADAEGCDFRDIAQAFALDDGGILATDAMGPLRRFGADGAFARTLGRRGQGPGEYGFVFQPQVTAQGRVAWFDNTQMRIATLALDGTPGPVTRLLPPPTMASIHLVGEELVILDVPTTAPRGELVDASYRTVPAAGAPRVLARVRTPAQFDPGSDMRPMSGPFAVRVVADVGTGGDVVHGEGAAYDLLGFPAGGTPWRLVVDAPRRPVTSADRDSAQARLVAQFRVASAADLPPNIRDLLAQAPDRHPPIAVVRVLRDGTTWVRPNAGPPAATDRWDLFARDGSRVGQAALPRGARITDGARGWVLVVERDRDDVPRVVRYRVGAATTAAPSR